MLMIMHSYGQALEASDRINILQHGQITFDKLSAETSVGELTELVIAEYRNRCTARRAATS